MPYRQGKMAAVIPMLQGEQCCRVAATKPEIVAGLPRPAVPSVLGWTLSLHLEASASKS